MTNRLILAQSSRECFFAAADVRIELAGQVAAKQLVDLVIAFVHNILTPTLPVLR